jgi:Na(+)-translocating NADH:ubiquinone oxidoreductase B subunit
VKLLLDIFEKTKPLFEKRFLAPLKPVHDALDHFFFSPRESTVCSPFARDPLDLKRYMSMVIIGMLPCVLMAYYLFGLRIIAMIIVSYMAGGLVEVVFAAIRKEPIAEGFLVTGLIFPLVLPPTLPLWMIAVGVMFGVFIGKELFGGTGRNIFNPAIVARCFLMLAYPRPMSSGWVAPGSGIFGRALQYIPHENIDGITAATPLNLVRTSESMTDVLKEFSLCDLFIGKISGCIGETSSLFIIIGGVMLMLTKVSNWRSVVSTIGSAFVLAFILHASNSDRFPPALWSIFAGGLMFGAFFMTTDPVSSPATNTGKWFYGILIGTVTILIRNFSGYVEGVTFAILLGNIAAPLLDEVVLRFHIRSLADEG